MRVGLGKGAIETAMVGCRVRLAVLLSLCVLINSTISLDVLSFNIKRFGPTKYSNQDVIDVLIQIMEDYDLILIMELVDISQTVLPGFVDQLNQHVGSLGFMFNYTISERVGRSSYKEQYVFLYRTNTVEIINTFQYNDTNDQFERPPYAILVRSIKQGEETPPFFVVASHTRPTDAVNEINGLHDVFESAAKYFSTDTGMIVGDLNADCSYVSNTKYDSLDLILNTSFTWWIDKSDDTTTSASNCAYDGIITFSSLTPFVIDSSVEIVLFDQQYNLSADFTSDVSDHYPIKVTIKGTPQSSSFTVVTPTESPTSSISTDDNSGTVILAQISNYTLYILMLIVCLFLWH